VITDHSDYFWDKWEWDEEVEANNLTDEQGRFTSLLGYEWTHPVFGHWNVLFRHNTTDMPLTVCSPIKEWPVCSTLEKLTEHLETKLASDDFLISLAHPASPKCVANLDYFNSQVRLIEVANNEGTHTYAGAAGSGKNFVKYGNFVFDALVRGYRVGFVGALDYHEPQPAPSHLTGVWADSLTRNDIFQAMYERRTFATTGTRTAIHFTVNGRSMGSIIPFSIDTIDEVFPLQMEIEILPSSRISKVCIYDVNGLWRTFDAPTPDSDGAIRLYTEFENEIVYDNYCNCYNRCFHVYAEEENGNCAWSSPVYLVFDWKGKDNVPK